MRFLAVLTVYVLGFVSTAHGQVQASEAHSSFEPSYIPTTTIQPCDYWQTDSSSGSFNYVCAYRPYRIRIVEANHIQNIVNTLEQRIAELETRIANLESSR